MFTRVVSLAEKEGKHVELLVVPGTNPFDALVQTAATLQASRLVTGVSERMTSEELARRIGRAWEKLPEPRHPFSLEIISPERASVFVNLVSTWFTTFGSAEREIRILNCTIGMS